ncbi:MAG: hypothetical protein R3330_15005, partial [Saprospiraceae bacterium]|nr:hypothetical protein [Saprospiraceae bacterium]
MKTFRYNLTALFLLMLGTASAQVERSRTVEQSWPNIREVVVAHRHGELEVIPHSGNDVRLEAVMTVRANKEEDAQAAVDHFDVKIDVRGERLTLTTQFATKNWITTMGTTRIKFDDGDTAGGIKDLSIDYRLHIPKLTYLELSNKYQDILISGDLTGALTVTQYDADVRANNVSGKVHLNVKYGGATIGQTGDAEIELYDSKLDLERATNVSVKSKYSEYHIGACARLDIQSYDDDVNLTSIDGKLSINDKYSDYTIGSAGASHIQSYDGEFKIDKTGDHTGMTSYSTYQIGSAANVALEKSYDDEIEIDVLTSFSCANSKYSKYAFGTLARSAAIDQSYDDDLRVKQVSPEFASFSVDSKYTSISLPLGQLPGYSLEATT